MKGRQTGAVLAVSLMVLLLLTVLILAGNRTVLLQEKMTTAVLDGQISLQTTESALLEAQAYVEALSDTSNFSDSGDMSGFEGLYSQDNGPINVFQDATWITTAGGSGTRNVAVAAVGMTSQGQSQTAHFFIEELGEMTLEDENSTGLNMNGYGQTSNGGKVSAFRIVARGMGSSGKAERIVEVFYGKSI